MVPKAGLEPARHKPRDFKSLASTIFATWGVLLLEREVLNIALFDEEIVRLWARKVKLLISLLEHPFSKEVLQPGRI